MIGPTDATLREQDALARRAAQTIYSHPIVLQAGAGTGKTSALVARIVVWSMGEGWERAETALLSVGYEDPAPERVAVRALSRVVAITFTEAASNEMNERVGEALVQIQAGELPRGILEDRLPDDVMLRERRAAALLSALDHLLVRTIHAFCRRLLSRHPLEAGLHPNFDVDADEARLEEIVRAVVLEHTHAALSEPVDPAFRRLFALGYQPQQMFQTLQRLAAEAAPAEMLSRDPLAPGPVRLLAERLRGALSALVLTVGARLAGASRSPSSVEVLKMARRLIDRLDGLLNDPDGAPVVLDRVQQWVADLFSENLHNRLKEWRRGRLNGTEEDRLGDIVDPLAHAADGLYVLLRHVGRLDPERLDLSRRVLHPMLAEVHRRMRAAGVETFSALLADARALLSRRPDVRVTIQASIDQLLVDEFQDTDALQCDVVRWLALEGDDRPGLFIVGDPKQSIYGWRNADLRAYDAFVHEVIGAGGQRFTLSVNFRSVSPILDEVASVISPSMRVEEGLQPHFQPLIPNRVEEQGFEAGDRAPVEYWNAWAWDGETPLTDTRSDAATEVEAAALAADIRRLHDEHEVPWSSVGLLMRSSGDLDRYLRCLRDAHIPYIVERDRSYYRRREIIDAAAMVRAIFDPLDHLALIGFLRSSVCGLPDAALLPLWERGFPGKMSSLMNPDSPLLADIKGMLADAARLLEAQAAEIPGVDRVEGWAAVVGLAITDLARSRAELLRLPSDVFVERLRGRMMLEVMEAARYQGVYRVANLDRFFRRLQQALEDGGDIEAVLRALRRSVAEVAEDEEGRPKEAIEDAVNVMTIHKAKGLDFDHVYVLQMHRTGDEARMPFTAADQRTARQWEYVLMGTPSLGWDQVTRYQRNVAAAERVRLLYVAMTRARDRLVLSGRWRAKPRVVDPQDARCLMDLISGRQGGLPDPGHLARTAAGAQTDRVSSGGLRWVFPGRGGLSPTPPPPTTPEHDAPTPEAVRELSAKLARDRVKARQVERRPRGGPAWATPDALPVDEQIARIPGLSMSIHPRQAAGNAIKRALAAWDLSEHPDVAAAAARERLASSIRPLLRPEQVLGAVRIAGATLDRLLSHGWIERLTALAPHTHARGMPMLVPPEPGEDQPVGFLSGTLDLVYTDPEDGELVVAEFKTDPTCDAARIDAYRSQGHRYTRAVQDALGLPAPPRWELWFLAHGVTHREG